jgi:hypothetical protein
MRKIQCANPYAGRMAGREILRGADGLSALKIYFLDITGRADPRRTEWDLCGRSREGFLRDLAARAPEGVGFVTAFPHVTKVFRFSPDAEIVMDVRGFLTPGLADWPLSRPEGWTEFACLAEALIAADEFRLWADSARVEDYLAAWSGFPEARIADPGKMRRYFEAGREEP